MCTCPTVPVWPGYGPFMAEELQRLLDEIDVRRFDVDEIVTALNGYSRLSDDEQEDALGPWEYAGLVDARHVLSGLLPEVHHDTVVVRDLTGELLLVWADGMANNWHSGLLSQGNLQSTDLLDDVLDAAEDDLSALSRGLVLRTIRALPVADASTVRGY